MKKDRFAFEAERFVCDREKYKQCKDTLYRKVLKIREEEKRSSILPIGIYVSLKTKQHDTNV
jgi:hypothetical protein